ncbi:MAG TPA: hypothetical protein VGT40_17025 [Methylomirabilota bacterium]|nr:hypothetical protein [Methylomirabilota bacterium]
MAEVSPVFERLYMFPYRFYPVDEQPAADRVRLLRMNMGAWRHSLLRAYDERHKLKDASAELQYLKDHVEVPALHFLTRGDPIRRELQYLHYRCLSAVESFHTALKHVLDRIALTVPWYFGDTLSGARKGSHHRMFLGRFHSIHHRIAGTEPPSSPMTALMDSLNNRIVTFRNNEIEHPDDAGDGFTVDLSQRSLDEGGYLRMFAVSVRDPFADTRPLENPNLLVTDVETYIGLILDYLEKYEDKSIFRRT